MTKTYSTRTSARRAATAACRKALCAAGLSASDYQAAEGHDFLIHPQPPTVDQIIAGQYSDRYSFQLVGPASHMTKGTE